MLATKAEINKDYSKEESYLMAKWHYSNARKALAFGYFYQAFLSFKKGFRHSVAARI